MDFKNRFLYLIGHGLLARRLGVKSHPTQRSEFWATTSEGHRLYCHLHRPAGPGVYPGVVLVPGANNAGDIFDRAGVVNADELASLGFAVVHYDPSGRGRSGGAEDHWGPAHQQELAGLLRHVSGLEGVDADAGLTVFSLSIGIIIASGALCHNDLPPIHALFDWEGPSNRFIITKNDTHEPLRAYPTHNEEFWSVREPVSLIGGVCCGYFRYQAERDHVQGGLKDHAIELVNAATQGRAAWTQLNDNPPNKLFDIAAPGCAYWVRAAQNHRETILRFFLAVSRRPSP